MKSKNALTTRTAGWAKLGRTERIEEYGTAADLRVNPPVMGSKPPDRIRSIEEGLVRSSGFEPPRYCYRQPLKLVRLPIPPRPQTEYFEKF
jgi:hypothetical protein